MFSRSRVSQALCATGLIASAAVFAPMSFAAQSDCVVNAKITIQSQRVPEGTMVQLNGTPSKPSQGIQYVWSQTAGPPVTLSDSTVSKPTFIAPQVGSDGATLTFMLTVKACSPLLSDFTTTNILVTDTNTNTPPQNQAPVASATAPTVVNEGDTVTLDGSASSDPDADALSYAWTQIGGPTVALSNASTSVASFVAPDVAYPNGVSLTFRLTVSDGALDSTTEKTVSIKWVNDPPVARLSCTQEVDEGQTVTLDGAGSTDADDGIASYNWQQLSGPTDAGISALSGSSVTFVAPKLGYQQDGHLQFQLTVADLSGVKSSDTCSVLIRDITPPVFAPTADRNVEATSAAGASVTYDVPASDAVDGEVAVSCAPPSGSTFALGTTAVSCSAEDAAGNSASASFNVSVVDTTPPSIAAHGVVSEEATGPNGATVQYTAPTATDIVDGAVGVSCLPVSGSVFALGETTVSCSAKDKAGNASSTQFTVSVVDTTPPMIAALSDVNVFATSNSTAVVTYPLPTAYDLVDGNESVTCTPASGSTFPVGSTSITCSASDARNNASHGYFNVVVTYNWIGFFSPVDNLPTLNVVKAGSAVPIKFSLGGNQGLGILAAGYPASSSIACNGSAVQDAIEETVTAGSSSLTYDATAGQYVYVWKTDKTWAGTCRQFSVKLGDGSVHNAQFKFMK